MFGSRHATAGVLFAGALCATPAAASGVDLEFSYRNPAAFTAPQRAILDDAIVYAEALWEGLITGYQPGITIPVVPVEIRTISTGLASAAFSTTTNQGGFRLTTSGFININPDELETFASWPRMDAGFGLNFVDDLVAHELGHVLGIGTLWVSNGVYVNNSFRYTGEHGLAAFREEFDPDAEFIPVENAGSVGTMNSHWDQLMRSSTQEGNPSDPFSLSPETGLLDAMGRDLAFELLTGAIDPDFGEPFLSNFTVQSMRDLGYTVIPEPTGVALLGVAAPLVLSRRRKG